MKRPCLFGSCVVLALLFFGCAGSDKQQLANRFLVPDVSGTGKFGYIDRSGNVVFDQEYKFAFPFSEGLALAGDENGDVFYMNENGTKVIEYNAEEVSTLSFFKDGLAAVEFQNEEAQGGLSFSYIDRNGVKQIPGPFAYAAPFSEGLAYVYYEPGYGLDDGIMGGFINTGGEMVLPLHSEPPVGYISPFSEGFFLIEELTPEGELVLQFRDQQGAVLETPPFKTASLFSEGLAVVQVEGDLWGYIDQEGDYVIEPKKYKYAFPFTEGLACIANQGAAFFLNREGKRVIDEIFDDCIPFHANGLAGVRKDEQVGYIDKSGNFIVRLSNRYELSWQPMLTDIYPDILPKLTAFHKTILPKYLTSKYQGKLLEAVYINGVGRTMIYFDENGNIVYPKDISSNHSL